MPVEFKDSVTIKKEDENENNKENENEVTLPRKAKLEAYAKWPNLDSVKQKRKLPNCKSYLYVKCTKCGLHLYLSKNYNRSVKFRRFCDFLLAFTLYT